MSGKTPKEARHELLREMQAIEQGFAALPFDPAAFDLTPLTPEDKQRLVAAKSELAALVLKLRVKAQTYTLKGDEQTFSISEEAAKHGLTLVKGYERFRPRKLENFVWQEVRPLPDGATRHAAPPAGFFIAPDCRRT